MSKGFAKHQERTAALNRFAKDLVRRSRSKCELCGEGDTRLDIFECPPVTHEPDFETLLMICETCGEQLRKPKTLDIQHWNFLREAIWSDLTPVQVVAIRVLNAIKGQAPWAVDLLEEAYLDDPVLEWAGKVPLVIK